MSNWDAVKRYRARHPERHQASIKKQNAKHHGPEWAASMRRYRKENPDRMARLERERNIRNADERRAQRMKRRARKREAVCSCCTAKQFAEFYAVAALVCYQVDHIVPLADGGAHCIKNLQMLPVDVHAKKTAEENSRRRRRL
jgi:5-methylcytosine-specific restriction endonuclease McrA